MQHQFAKSLSLAAWLAVRMSATDLLTVAEAVSGPGKMSHLQYYHVEIDIIGAVTLKN